MPKKSSSKRPRPKKDEIRFRVDDHNTIMVIMPFVESPTRGQKELDDFFAQLKNHIESSELQHSYRVIRSDDRFNITKAIILDLFESNILICDLSGTKPNPNVMYELGIRLALSDKPVIAIREQNSNNSQIFDVSGFYTYQYDPFNYDELKIFLFEKISRIESGEEIFSSPVRDFLVESGVSLATRNTASFHAISNLYLGILLAAKGYNGNIIEFVARIAPQVGRPPMDCTDIQAVEWWISNVDDLQTIDWSKNRCWPSTNPLIDGFWHCSELRDSLPEAVYLNLYGFMINYHQHYFGVGAGWDIDPVVTTAHYFLDTATVITALEPVKYLLTPEGRRQLKKLSQQALQYLRVSSTWVGERELSPT